MNSWIEITDDKGTRIVDMDPVESYADNLRATIQQRRFFKVPTRAEALRKMSQEQLVYLASTLTCMVEEYAWLYDGSFSKEHAELVDKLREVKKAADESGLELWPELSKQLKR